MASNGVDAATAVVLVVVGFVVLVLVTMGIGFGGMMGYGVHGTTGVWWPLVGMLVPLVGLLVLLGGGYLLVQRTTEAGTSRNPAMEELRLAYARGDLTDEEFEARRETLERSE